MHIPLSELMARLDEVPDAQMLVVCKVGARSAPRGGVPASAGPRRRQPRRRAAGLGGGRPAAGQRDRPAASSCSRPSARLPGRPEVRAGLLQVALECGGLLLLLLAVGPRRGGRGPRGSRRRRDRRSSRGRARGPALASSGMSSGTPTSSNFSAASFSFCMYRWSRRCRSRPASLEKSWKPPQNSSCDADSSRHAVALPATSTRLAATSPTFMSIPPGLVGRGHPPTPSPGTPRARASRPQYSSRATSTTPRAARCGVSHCTSSSRSAAYSSRIRSTSADQRHLGRVPHSAEHRLAGEQPADRDAVEPADQPVVAASTRPSGPSRAGAARM